MIEAHRPFDAVILAAGHGTRLKSRVPKVLHRLAGRPLIDHVLETVRPLAVSRTVVVTGAGSEFVDHHLANLPAEIEIVHQDPPRGTGDALAKAGPLLQGRDGLVLVLSGDVPLLRSSTLDGLLAAAAEADGGAILTARLTDPGRYGRVIRGTDGGVEKIVEARDATAEELEVGEVNAGIYVFPHDLVWQALGGLAPDNAQNEYYLTDIVASIRQSGRRIAVQVLDDAEEMSGINDREDLARAARILNQRTCRRLMAEGVTIVDPASTWVDESVEIGTDSILHPFVRLEGRSRLGNNVEIRSFCRLSDSEVGDDCRLLEGVVAVEASLASNCQVGPWAHLRPGTRLEEDVRIGNFVETKKAHLARGVKASHLSYLGDADIGRDVNIGAGTITCNYDGQTKHRTILEDGVFIGSDSQLVAPITVGRGAYVGAGSTVTKDVPPGALAVSRSPQRNVEGWVERRDQKRRDEKPAD